MLAGFRGVVATRFLGAGGLAVFLAPPVRIGDQTIRTFSLAVTREKMYLVLRLTIEHRQLLG